MAEGRWGRGAGGRATRVWAFALALAFLAVGVVRRDDEALGFAVLTSAGAGLTLVRGGTIGRVLLGLIATDTLVWMGPAAWANARGSERVADVAVPAVLAVLALAVLLLAIGLRPVLVLGVGVVLLIGALGATAALSGRGGIDSADARVGARNVAFHPTAVSIPQRGAIAVTNHDLFWHTFRVDKLGVETRIPTGATRVVRIDAPSGTYRFICAIPGHEGAGMKGTITVG